MNTRCRGVSLVIVLLLLAGIMLLAVSGLGGAIASMAMADLDERAARAFEAAEAGVSRTLGSGAAVSPAAAPWPSTDPAVTVQTQIRHDPPPQAPASPYGFSLGTGGGGFVLHHGSILAEGSAGRGTLVRIEQGFAIVGPARESAP
jgi:type II secretory pathway pseudopilin PulG